MARVIPQEAVEELTRQINTVSASMQQGLLEQLQKFDLNDMSQFDAVEQLMQLYCAGATDASALLAAEFYDASREYCIGEPMNAAAVSQRAPEATRIAMLGIMSNTKDKATIAAQLAGRLDYEIKRAAGDCTFYNGSNDKAGPRYARVPGGAETCTFCLMLASRGFVYRSARSAGELDHYHPHCDCRIVAGWGDNPHVDGYDPAEYYDKWQAALDEEALEKAEKNETSVAYEREKIAKRMREAAKRSKQRHPAPTVEKPKTLYSQLRDAITNSTESSDFNRALANISRMQSKGDITGGQAQALRIAINKRKKNLGI